MSMRACVRACLCLRVFERVCLSASERAGDRACVRTRVRVRAGVSGPRILALSGCVPEDVPELVELAVLETLLVVTSESLLGNTAS